MADYHDVYLLSWASMDPRRHPFDPATVANVVRAHPAAVHEGLIKAYGPWAGHWTWSADYGGPVRVRPGPAKLKASDLIPK